MSNRVVQKWYADWCAPCKSLEPKLVKVAEEFGAEVQHMNVEEYGELAKELLIRSIPSLVLYEDDVLLVSRNGVGNTTEANLREMFGTAYGETNGSN